MTHQEPDYVMHSFTYINLIVTRQLGRQYLPGASPPGHAILIKISVSAKETYSDNIGIFRIII